MSILNAETILSGEDASLFMDKMKDYNLWTIRVSDFSVDYGYLDEAVFINGWIGSDSKRRIRISVLTNPLMFRDVRQKIARNTHVPIIKGTSTKWFAVWEWIECTPKWYHRGPWEDRIKSTLDQLAVKIVAMDAKVDREHKETMERIRKYWTLFSK